MNLLFVSNLFPSGDEPIRGLDNATLLPYLREAGVESIRAVGLRPSPDPRRWGLRTDRSPRKCDEPFSPNFVGVPYLPKIGSRINHRLVDRAVSPTLDRFHRESPIDAVLVSWLYPDACGVARWCERNKVPFVMICQGSDGHIYLENPVRRKLILSAVSASRGVVTRSADLATRLVSYGADSSKISTIYNGVDTSVFFPGDSIAARLSLPLPDSGSVILFVGNFLPVKNPLLLVEAWKKFSLTRHCTLVMIGSGPLESQIRALAAGSPDLVMPGRLPPESVARYMRAADLLCLSSFGEGVPNVVLESFGCGLPVLSTDVGGISEVLDREELGQLVPSGDEALYTNGLRDLLENPPDRDRIAAIGRKYTWESTSQRYASLLLNAAKTEI